MSAKHEITRDDILPIEEYGKNRAERRRQITEMKRKRRVGVGPHATFYFENYDTMWHQIHEMLFIEKGGEAQIPDELRAYNPLVPKGNELVATVMFEIDDREQRQAFLSKMGGVEETMTLRFDGETIEGVPEQDVDRSTADGKASSVQFVHFPFTEAQIETFRTPGTEVELAINHPRYTHKTVLPEEVREALAGDFD